MRRLLGRIMGGIVGPAMATCKPKAQEDDPDNNSTELQTTTDKIFLISLPSQYTSLKIFSLDAQKLARQVASHLDIGLGRLNSTRFNDGEINLQILDSVRGQSVYLIKNFEDQNVNDGIIELLLAVATMKKQGAKRVTAIVPYFPYSLPTSSQSHGDVTEGYDFFTCFGADLVKMLQALGCDQIVTLNSSMSNPKGFALSSTFLNLRATEVVIPYLLFSGIKDPVMIGARSNRLHLREVHELSRIFRLFDYNCGIGFFNDGTYLGDGFDGRDVVLFSNQIRSGSTMRTLSKSLKQKGARNIYCFGFHGHCTNDQLVKMVDELPIKELILTNSVQHSLQNKKIRYVSLAKLVAEVITVISGNQSLSQFRGNREMYTYGYFQKIKKMNKDREQNQTQKHDINQP